MAWNTPDVYYDPEKFGLTKIAELDYTMHAYSFNLYIVWQHEDGRIFAASDSGCSCPSPFEDYTTLESLVPFEIPDFHKAVEDAMAIVENEAFGRHNDGQQYLDDMAASYADFVADLSKAAAKE